MSPLSLWKVDASPPAAAVRALLDLLGFEHDCIDVDFLSKEHKSPEYMKMNPLGTVPLLKDGDFYLTDSHAIMKYLVRQYGGRAAEALYPLAPREQARVDQCCYFDTGVFFVRLKVVALPSIYEGMSGPSPRHLADIAEAYGVVEAYLEGGEYLVGDRLTLADISVGMTTAAMQSILKVDGDKFPRTVAWLDRLNTVPEFKKYADLSYGNLSAILNGAWEKNKQ